MKTLIITLFLLVFVGGCSQSITIESDLTVFGNISDNNESNGTFNINSLGIGSFEAKTPKLWVDCENIKPVQNTFFNEWWAITDCAILETLIHEDLRYEANIVLAKLESVKYWANLEAFNKTFYDSNICYLVHNQSVGRC